VQKAKKSQLREVFEMSLSPRVKRETRHRIRMAACKTENCKSKATYGFRFAEPEYCITHGRAAGAKTQYGVCVCGLSTPRFAAKDEKASCCAKCKTDDMKNVADRHCKCGKHLPTYGFPEDKRAEYCSECKKGEMINLKDKNKKCLCGKVIPSFGLIGEKPTCCVACKKEGMINLVLKKCSCGKSAVFGKKGGKPTHCGKCKEEGMENIVTKKCTCGKAVPVFGFKTDKSPKFCSSCKKEGMINITKSLCKCGKAQPRFGNEGEEAHFCASCKEDTMINLYDKKCACGKAQPVFAVKGSTVATHCVSCKTNDLVNIKAKMCKCGKAQPNFGMKGDIRPTCCFACKTEGMLDIQSKKCKGLINYQGNPMDCPYDHRAKEKYSSYCTACFAQNFPNDPRTALIHCKTHETVVKNFLSTEYGYFIHDKSLWTGQADCTCRRRIDFRTLIGNTLLCIEVDERQHKDRDEEDEELRYDDLMMLHGGKFVFIRYNPDLYIDAEGKRKNPSTLSRLVRLKQEIQLQMKRIQEEKNSELLEVVELFYDEL
jgi:hypothetical protein